MKKGLIILVIVGSIVGIGTFIYHPIFLIQKVAIRSTNFINPDTIQKHVKPLLGKNIGSILFLNKFSNQLKKLHPPLQHVKFKVKLPNQIEVIVTEKTPWATFLSGKNNYVIAADGTILNRNSTQAQVSNINELIIIRGVENSEFQKQYISSELLQSSKVIIDNIQFYFPYENMQIDYLDKHQIAIIKDDTLTIKIGNLDVLDLKFRNLKSYLKKYGHQTDQLEYIDLRIEDKIITKKAI